MGFQFKVAGKGSIVQGGKTYGPGSVFPAEDLGMSPSQVDNLIASGALADPRAKPEPSEPNPDGLDAMSKGDLEAQAKELGVEILARSTKPEIIAAIRAAVD